MTMGGMCEVGCGVGCVWWGCVGKEACRAGYVGTCECGCLVRSRHARKVLMQRTRRMKTCCHNILWTVCVALLPQVTFLTGFGTMSDS